MKEAILYLQDQTCFRGRTLKETGETAGEAIFNTAMTGYQEVLTDPSYTGQIVVMTYPLIGNYGVNDEDDKCINEPGPISNFGCPLIPESTGMREDLGLRARIFFATGTSKLAKTSVVLVDSVIQMLNHNPFHKTHHK